MNTELYRRIGLIGDIHAEDERLERALDFLAARGVEIIVTTGDVVDGPGDAERCCRLLEERGVVTVKGNHDRWLLANSMRALPDATPRENLSAESLRLLAHLPTTIELETVRGRALLCHGLGLNDLTMVGPGDYGYAIEANTDLQALIRVDAYRWILNGHSHRRTLRNFGGVTIINAGTLLRHHEPCFFKLDFGNDRARVFTFHVDAEIEELSTEATATPAARTRGLVQKRCSVSPKTPMELATSPTFSAV